MGACYYIEYKIFPKDSEKCISALKNYLEEVHIDHNGSSLEELIRTILLANNAKSVYVKQDEGIYCNTFDASYMYEIALDEAFYAMSPYLMDGSTAYIEPDDYHYKITIKDGKCIDTRNAKVKNLRKADVPKVKEMDEKSGFNVLSFLEDYVEDGVDEADHCFGIFYNDDLIGYCSLGYADGAIDIPTKCDDTFLSDVYIEEEWRKLHFGSTLVQYVIESLEDDCYLTFLYDELENFYERFGFEKVNGTDNIMVKYF